jgi:hypothetical protein
MDGSDPMKKARVLCLLGATTLAVTGTLIAAPAAQAHVEADIGKYHVAVGFGTEPVYAGQVNSVQMFLHYKASDKPVLNLGDTLKVSVQFGNQTKDLGTMKPFFEVGESGIPGDYRAWFIPTRSGPYTFHFTGKIFSQKVDKSFTSGKKTFDSAVDPGGIEFPVQDPTNAELAGRIQQEVPRLTAAASDASDAASSAKAVATIGVVVGALGLIVGIAALATRRRAT